MSYINSHSLLRRAHAELDAAALESSPREQFMHAHMAALRGAAAALSVAAVGPGPKRRKVRSAWVLLAEAGSEWQPWVDYYTVSAATRAALESGQLREIESDQARAAVRVASQFLSTVEAFLQRQDVELRALAQAS